MNIPVFAILSLLSVLGEGCVARQDVPPSSITIEKDRAVVHGAVRENVKRCEVDGPCYLVLEADGAPVRVYYHHGEYPPCANKDATAIGLSIAVGEIINATGLYSVVDRTHTVDVCCQGCHLAITRRP